MVGRRFRSIWNFSAKTLLSSGPCKALISERKAGPKVNSDTGKLPGVSIVGKSALMAALASGRMKLGTIRYSNGWRISGVAANAAKSSAYIDHASLHSGTGLADR